VSNFSKRIKKLLDKEFNLFESELRNVYNELAAQWNLKNIDQLKLIIKPGINSGNPFEVASTIEYKNNIYEVDFYKDAVGNALKYLTYNNKSVYKSREMVIKNAAAHEACHLILIQLNISAKENGSHGSMFRNIYEPIRKRYTDVPFVISYDGKKCNFVDDGNVVNSFRENFSMIS